MKIKVIKPIQRALARQCIQKNCTTACAARPAASGQVPVHGKGASKTKPNQTKPQEKAACHSRALLCHELTLHNKI